MGGPPVVMPEPPAEVAHVWGWFAELHGQRSEFGQALRWLDIWAWADLHGHRLSPLELEALKAYDAAYLEYCRREQEKRVN